jgi:hypothetical protein
MHSHLDSTQTQQYRDDSFMLRQDNNTAADMFRPSHVRFELFEERELAS